METKIVKTDDEIKDLVKMADDVWHEAFAQMITTEQIDYMLEKFLSVDAIKASFETGYEYYFLCDGDVTVGFVAICPKSDNTLFLSKLYILSEYRGKGYLGSTFDFLKKYVTNKELSSIWLTVNKHNGRAIAAYKKTGMDIIRSEVTDIGSGFVMDDYVFELQSSKF
ncbi:MAG: GNAT family N-acetyltransferase [Ruminococcus sp.]|nr:GNAT family N-acetyltransferase [Ruminococcus sp.]